MPISLSLMLLNCSDLVRPYMTSGDSLLRAGPMSKSQIELCITFLDTATRRRKQLRCVRAKNSGLCR
ncbi:hypothetical protein GCK32_021024 [Trichostrongylus colubriformis]|uniref:Uncharacterized protein n=1 Tax=Trichostrongylus colubriformis TaxID=6319 RepID=A0AAN8F824_TRICO